MNTMNVMDTKITIKPTPEMRKALEYIRVIVDEERDVINAILNNTPLTIKQVEKLFDYYINELGLNLNYSEIDEIKLYWLIKNSPEYKKYELNKILTN